MRFTTLLVFIAVAVMAVMAKDLRADTTTGAPATTKVTEAPNTGSTVTGGSDATTGSTQAPATTTDGASTIASGSALLISVVMCFLKF